MKQFSCACGCKHFRLINHTLTLVDFSREGAIEGHPHIRNAGTRFVSLTCTNCGATVPDEQAQEMLVEII